MTVYEEVTVAVTLCLLFGACQRSLGAPCGDACQAEQRQALQQFFISVSGASWLNSSRWDLSGGTNVSAALPAHCTWFGVTCCSATGVARVFSPYTAPVILSCSQPGAVVGLRLVTNGLRGDLPGPAVWQPLSSLLYLKLSGALVVTWWEGGLWHQKACHFVNPAKARQAASSLACTRQWQRAGLQADREI